MQKYVDYLIIDLQNAKKNVPAGTKPGDGYETFEDHMMALEESPDIRLSDLFGISEEVFPPTENLSEIQLEQLNEAILDMWRAFNIETDYPEDVPATLLYPALVAQFSKETHYWPGWQMGIELCNFEPDKCPFGNELCTCKEYFQDDSNNPKS